MRGNGDAAVTLLIALLAAVAAFLLVTGLSTARSSSPPPRVRHVRRRTRPDLERAAAPGRRHVVTVALPGDGRRVDRGDVPRRLRADGHAGVGGGSGRGRRVRPADLLPAPATPARWRPAWRRGRKAIRDVLSHITVGSTLHGALVQLGRSGPEPLRPVWRRYAVQRLGARRCPPRSRRPATSCPTRCRTGSSRAFVAAHERGQSVVVDVLRTFADDVTKDLQLNEQIITGQTEVRAQAVVAALLPFFVLAVVGVVQRRVPRLLPLDRRVRRDLHRRRHGVRRLEADQRHRAPARGSPRVGGGADEGRVVNGQVLAIAVLAAVAAGCLVRACVRSPGPARAVRLAPYTDRARGQLGTATATRPPASTSVWGPMVTAVADRLGAALGSGSTSELELRLRRAGLGTMHGRRVPPPAARLHRRRVGDRRLVGVAAAAEHDAWRWWSPASAAASVRSAWRAKVDGLIDDRQHRDASRGPHRVSDARRVAAHRRHPVRGARPAGPSHRRGSCPASWPRPPPRSAPGRHPPTSSNGWPTQTAEPSAARLYRLYGAIWSAGGDPASLLALSDSLRASRRDDSPARWPAAASRWRSRSSP